MVYLDSNFIVALIVGEHAHHARAIAIYRRVSTERLRVCTSAHALLETTLNASRRYSRSPALVWKALRDWRSRDLAVAPITLESYERTLDLSAALDLRTPLIYDLLHCVCADAAGAGEVWTFDLKDYSRLQAVTNATVVVPPAVPA